MKLNLERWKDLLGQVEVLKTYYARLTDRERYIVLSSAAGGVLFLMVLTYSAFAAATSSLASKISASQENLAKINDLREVYIQIERQMKELERVISRTPPGFQLGTHLEQIANGKGVKIDSLRDRPGPPNDLYRETQVEVSVRQVSLLTLVQFLFEIENSPELMRVSSLRVKPNFQDATQLNVTFVVSTFQPAQGS